jgi:hypothetical protein
VDNRCTSGPFAAPSARAGWFSLSLVLVTMPGVACSFDASSRAQTDGAPQDGPVRDAPLPSDSAPEPDVAVTPDSAPEACVQCDDGVACTTQACAVGMGCLPPEDICPIGTCDTATSLCRATLTFREGVSGYVGTHDTHLREADRNANYGDSPSVSWDADDPNTSGRETAALIRFDRIFGPKTGRIPLGAIIEAASLTMTIVDGSGGPAGSVHHVLVSWSEATATWANFGNGPGIQPNELGPQVAAAPQDACAAPPCPAAIDVTASLIAWQDGAIENLGWAFRAAAADGLDIASSEATDASQRPALTVTFTFALPTP